MKQWMHMETAPKDGTNILVMYFHMNTQCVFNAFYIPHEQDPDLEGWWACVFNETSRYKLDDIRTPKYWMPLPELLKGE